MHRDPSSGPVEGADTLSLQPGAVVAERYRLERPLTQAGKIWSWAAIDETLNAPATLQLHDGGDAYYDRLNRLHDRLGTIDHPVVHGGYDIGREVGGTIFVATEQLGVATLDEVRNADVRTAVRLAIELLHGIDAAHQAGVVHGDICTQVVLLEPGEDGLLHARLVDFVVGVTRDSDSGPTPGVSKDIRGVAEVLYELLTGQPAGDQHPILTPRSGLDVPQTLSTIVLDQLNDPDTYPSALSLARPLEAVLADLNKGGAGVGMEQLQDALLAVGRRSEPQEIIRALPAVVASVTGAASVELVEVGLRGRLIVTGRHGVGNDFTKGALPAELRRTLAGPPKKFRALAAEAEHAALLPVRLGDARVTVVAVPPQGQEFDSQTLAAASIVVAHTASLVERLLVRRSMLDETACRAATLDLVGDAVLLLGAHGIVRACSEAAAELLDVHREAVVGRVLRDVAGMSELASKLASLHGLDNVIVSLGREDVVVSSRQFPGGVVARLEPVTQGGTVSSVKRSLGRLSFDALVGQDPKMLGARRTAQHAAADGRPIVIIGEPGTGRRTLAEAVHRASRRSEGPFLTVDVSRMLPGGIEAELFGAAPGSNAAKTYGGPIPGKIELAHGGTLVIVGADKLLASVQTRLATTAVDGTFKRLGSEETVRCSVRLIVVMKHLPEHGALKDLTSAATVTRIDLPPLRERVQDLPMLAAYLMERASAHLSRAPLEIGSDVMGDLARYHWPGNVRELSELVEAWLSLLPVDATQVERTPAHIRRALESS